MLSLNLTGDIDLVTPTIKIGSMGALKTGQVSTDVHVRVPMFLPKLGHNRAAYTGIVHTTPRPGSKVDVMHPSVQIR